VISHTASTFFAAGGNQYSPTGVRLLRFQISDGHSFLDPMSLRLAYTIRNDAAQPMELLATSPLCLSQRLRILLNGQLVEDVNFLHRTDQMFEVLQPLGRRFRDAHLGWGTQDAVAWESTYVQDQVPGNGTRKVLGGLMDQHLHIPLRFAPLTIELEVNPLVEQYLRSSVVGELRSTAYTILDAQTKADVLELDPAIVEKMNAHLRNGGSHPVTFSSWFTTFNTLPDVDQTAVTFAVQIARSFSRI